MKLQKKLSNFSLANKQNVENRKCLESCVQMVNLFSTSELKEQANENQKGTEIATCEPIENIISSPLNVSDGHDLQLILE